MNNQIVTLKEFENQFLNQQNKVGFEKVQRVSLLSEAFPTNFTPSGGEEHLSNILSKVNPRESFCTIQPCFRYQDIEKIYTGQHLPLFEMGIAISINQLSIEELINQFFKLFDYFKLDRKKITISIFSGGKVLNKEIPKDDLSKQIWNRYGIDESQFIFLDSTENFFLLKKQGYAGIKTEVFYEFNNELIELAVIVKLTHSVIENHFEDYYLDSFDDSVVCFGVGCERWVTIVNGKNSILELDEFKLISDLNQKFSVSINRIALLNYSLINLIYDGAKLENMAHGRASLFKKIIRKLKKSLIDSSITFDIYQEEILIKQIDDFILKHDKQISNNDLKNLFLDQLMSIG